MNPSILAAASLLLALSARSGEPAPPPVQTPKFERAPAPDPETLPKTAPLTWSAERLNEDLAPTRGKKTPVVGVHFVVFDDAKKGSADASLGLSYANHIWNGFDPYEAKDYAGGEKPVPKKGSTPCGVSFEFRSARKITAPGKLGELKGSRDFRPEDEYGSFDKLSAKETALLDAVGPPPPGCVQVVFVKSLGGGHGHTYSYRHLKGVVKRMAEKGLLPAGRSEEQVLAAYMNNVLLSDISHAETLAHELGHVLSLVHEPVGSDNLMADGGGLDTRLEEKQCGWARYAVRRHLGIK